MTPGFRIEKDLIGVLEIPVDVLRGKCSARINAGLKKKIDASKEEEGR